MSDSPLPTAFKKGHSGKVQSWPRLRSISALLLREMAARYGRSPGGYAWAILEPLGMIVMLSFGFSLIMRAPSLGNSFILFYATGFLPYSLFQKLSNLIGSALNHSRSLLTYPTVIWLDPIIACFLLFTMTELLVAFLLLNGILIATDSGTVLTFGPIFQAFAMAALLGLGLGLVNCAIMSAFPAWKSIWSVATRPLFLASGIILIYDIMPPFAQNILWYNPLMHISGIVRSGFYPTYNPQYVSPVYVMTWIMILLVFGLMLIRRYHRQIINR